MKINSLGIVSKPQLGGDIDAYCGKCKEIREHVVAALSTSGVVERVQCRTCQSNHLYRERNQKTAAPRAASRASASRKEVEAAAEPSGPLRQYSMRERFAVGDRLEHSKFGIGIVTEVRFGKIDVRFGRDLKTLVHAG